MKKIFIIVAVVLFCATAEAQPAEVTMEGTTKIVKGFMSKKDLATDSAFSWFATHQHGYVPEPNALQAFRASRDSINIIAFGGTWCGDTKNILPKFYALTDAAGLSPDRITLLGVDRNKKTIQHLTEAFNVTRVPTFIIMKNGKELGRVVEYGKYGMFDKELGEILSGN